MTARIRVLWLIKGLGPGGAERLLASFAKVADHGSFDYEAAYLLPWKDHLVPALETSGVTVHCLGARGEWDLRWAWRLRGLLTQRSFDVVHIHSPYAAAVARPLIRSLPRTTRPRVVYTEHNTWHSYERLTRALNAITFSWDDASLAVSHDVKASIRASLRQRTEVVVHGVDVDDIGTRRAERESARAELGVTGDEVLVGTVANYRADKDYPTLLLAARIVADRDIPVRFVAIGQGPLQREVEAEHQRLSLDTSMRLLGYQEDPLRVLAGCDLFALSSSNEGLPVSLMEALALGLPVVATNVGGIPEAVSDGVEGLLVPPGRPDLLAGGIAALAADPERRCLMSEAASTRAKTFDIRNAVDRVEAVYRETAKR